MNKEEKPEWTAEVRNFDIPTLELSLPNYVSGYLNLDDGDHVVFSETKNGEEHAMIMKKAKREC